MDEYLSREFVLSCVDDFLSKTDMPIAAQFFYDCFRECEAADVQPVKCGTAEYMHTLYTLRFMEVYKCSACGGEIEMKAGRHTPYSHENKPKFCPNCGAKMDLKEGEKNGNVKE